jgi:hypothetical protein
MKYAKKKYENKTNIKVNGEITLNEIGNEIIYKTSMVQHNDNKYLFYSQSAF